jgi:AcrR family transcriptional regulator
MSLAHRRKKQPAEVRAQLLEVAAELCAEVGIPNASLEAISRRAGVSKGGLLHHFPTKQALIEALTETLLADLSERIELHVAQDPDPRGRFTRAYLLACLEYRKKPTSDHWDTLAIMLGTEPGMRTRWTKWLSANMKRHGEREDTTACLIVRMAADGVWFSEAVGIPSVPRKQQGEFLQTLLSMSRTAD